MEMSMTEVFWARKIRLQTKSAKRISLTDFSHDLGVVSPRDFWSGLYAIICIVSGRPYTLTHLGKDEHTGKKVTNETTVHPTSESGISNALSINAYFLVPGLTIPHKNWKIYGIPLAKTLATHKLNQTTSIHAKNQYIFTPPIVAYRAPVAPTIMGIAINNATGVIYTRYRTRIDEFRIPL